MPTNYKTFKRRIKMEAVVVLLPALRRFTDEIAVDLWSRIILRTPVDIGIARGGWIASLGEPSEFSPIRIDKEGSATIAEAIAVLSPTRNPFEPLFLSNNVIYIQPLEDGHSRIQAPQGMVAVSLEEVMMTYGGRNR